MGVNYNNMKSIEYSDLKNSIGVYFINNSFSTSNIKKLLNFKLLNFFKYNNFNNQLLITQNNNLDIKLITKLRKSFGLNNHLHLPNTVLFETSGTFINTEGTINKITKVVTPLGQTKSD